MNLLKINKLSLSYPKQKNKALDKVSLSLNQGEALGVVGESGCGKSTLVRAILQLQAYQLGQISWKGQAIETFTAQKKKTFYQQVQLIFQDPLDALNPRLTISQIIAEPLVNLSDEKLSRLEINKKTEQMLEQVGLSPKVLNRYPHEFSGGQCQRIGIARAMIVEPELLICDEPVSALDVSVQAQIMNVLLDLKEMKQLSLIFISHDLSIVRHISDRVLVMNQGQVVEEGDANQIFQMPKNNYTKSLLKAIPKLNLEIGQ